jgi:pimeloyl-ACP methyl ester carboxylesterase
VASIAAGYAGICAILFFAQRSLLYFPQGRGDESGELLRLPGDVLVSTRPIAGPDAVVYFGGNAEDVSLNLPDFRAAFPGQALFLMHYRGYGGSAGSPSEEGLVADGFALLDRVLAAHPRVTLIGRSLGSGIAVRLAAARPVSRLVLVTPYDSILGIAQEQFAWFPVRWLLRDKHESWRYAPSILAPVLVLAAEHDEVIPRASTELLRTRFRQGKLRYIVIPGTGHNTIAQSAAYWEALREQ